MATNLPRRDFLSALGAGATFAGLSCPLLAQSAAPATSQSPTPPPSPTVASLSDALQKAKSEQQFTNNWLTDLFEAIDSELEPAARLKLLEACGRGCYRRHTFKQDIAAAGKGDIDKLLVAYQRNFRIQREGEIVNILYGGGKCFCPAARHRPARPNDLQCECTRATHESIWEAAMGRPYKIELVETIRRGGTRCHLRVKLT